MKMAKTLKELRSSAYHHQLGRKMCAAFVAQQQGIALNTAFNKIPADIADCWLIVAEFARQASAEMIDQDYLSERLERSTGPVM